MSNFNYKEWLQVGLSLKKELEDFEKQKEEFDKKLSEKQNGLFEHTLKVTRNETNRELTSKKYFRLGLDHVDVFREEGDALNIHKLSFQDIKEIYLILKEIGVYND